MRGIDQGINSGAGGGLPCVCVCVCVCVSVCTFSEKPFPPVQGDILTHVKYEVKEDVACEDDCSERLHPAKALFENHSLTHAHTHTHTHTHTAAKALCLLLPVRKVAFGNNFKKYLS